MKWWPALYRYFLGAILVAAGVLHLVSPDGFARIVPPALGNANAWVYASGVAEIAVGALLIPKGTRRLGGYLAVALFIAVFPANIYAALNGGYQSFGPPLNTRAAAYGRLPLQLVLIWWAWRIARQHG